MRTIRWSSASMKASRTGFAAGVNVRLRAFGLDHDAFKVGRGESRLGRAPGVEAHEVQAVDLMVR